MEKSPNLTGAVKEWEDSIGKENVIIDENKLNSYEKNTSGLQRKIPLVLLPKNTEQVQKIVEIANKYLTPLYPFSQGKNWGLGSRLPVKDNCVLVDLHNMNKIRNLNNRHRYVVIEPGVTQAQLYEFLQEKDPTLMFDATGSGSNTSLIGNSLERGVGYFASRIENLSGLEIVLGNGKILRTGFGHFKDAQSTHNYSNGVGPSLDGLFAESNYGIVTSAGMNLMPVPESHSSFISSINNPNLFPEFIDVLSELRAKGIIRTAIHIANKPRTEISLSPILYQYFNQELKLSDSESRKRINEVFQKEGFGAWSAVGGLMGTRGEVKESEYQIKRQMKRFGKTNFLTARKIELGNKVLNYFDMFDFAQRKKALLYAIEPVFNLTRGIPTNVSINSVYWPTGDNIHSSDSNPDNSESGLLYCLPMIPNNGGAARRVDLISNEISSKYGFIPYITMNTVNERALECVINIAFRKNTQLNEAHRCIDEMHEEFIGEGLIPYRLGIQSMSSILNSDDTFWQTTRDLKKVLDPNNIISPGRYNLI